MKSRLIILSDLWGKEKSQWVENYQNMLEEFYDITFYDSCELGEVNKSPYEEENLHKQFVDEGIETAVKNLLTAEPEKVTVLAFSIGGAIAWKAAMQSLRFDKMFLVSATRLRLEERKPLGRISLYYGKEDENRPDEGWVSRMNLRTELIPETGHEVYTSSDFAKFLSGKILAK